MSVFMCSCTERSKKESLSMYFFHDTACRSCDGTEEFYKVYDEKLKDLEKEAYPCKIFTNNVFQTNGRKKLESMAEEWGLDVSSIEFPVLLVNGRMFCGMEEIEKNIREQYLIGIQNGFKESESFKRENHLKEEDLFQGWETDPSHMTVVYCYRYTCPECEETFPFLNELPKEINIDGKKVPVDLIKINSREGRGGDRIRVLFEKYNVPEEKQGVPFVFLRDKYLSGYDEISTQLIPLLEKGEALDFCWP